MRRRALLATVGALGVAGCLGTGDGESSETPPATPPDDPPGEFEEISPVTTVESDAVDADPFSEVRVQQPTELPFAFSVSVASGESLPELTVTVTNRGERGYVMRSEGHYGLPFTGDVSGDREGETLVAGTVSRADPSADDLDCAVGRLGREPATERVELAPDDSESETGQVANHVDNTVCWPAGEHQFTQGYEVWSAEDAFRFEFAFSLVI